MIILPVLCWGDGITPNSTMGIDLGCSHMFRNNTQYPRHVSRLDQKQNSREAENLIRRRVFCVFLQISSPAPKAPVLLVLMPLKGPFSARISFMVSLGACVGALAVNVAPAESRATSPTQPSSQCGPLRWWAPHPPAWRRGKGGARKGG